jgi:hypothetical protein
MDWYSINYLYPSAFKRFGEVMFPNIGILSVSTLESYDIKKLYRFFDKEGIFLTTEMCNPNQWVYTIAVTNSVIMGSSEEIRKTREEIETDGFFSCFKILDKKLTHG